MSSPALSRDESRLTAWVDASAGVSGDMLLAALVDAGASLEVVRSAVEAVIPATVRIEAADAMRAGMRALKVDVALAAPDLSHRSWSDIRRLVDGAALDPGVRAKALAAFEALAHVEAGIHGVEVDDVHFHEVGAWDSIADVVGVCAAVEDLAVDALVASVIGVGSGSVQGAHGRIPVPVPAVLGLATGWALDSVGDGELATPTGVALLTTLASRQGPLPRMRVDAVGVGAGTEDVPGRPNVVRVVVGSTMPAAIEGGNMMPAAIEGGNMMPAAIEGGNTASTAQDNAGLEESAMVVLETNVDDLDPRVWPSVLATLIDQGAADAWLTPILMKKGRPAHVLSVLAHAADAPALKDTVLSHTSTIGVRQTNVQRWAMPRVWVDVDVEGQRLAVKVAHRHGRIVHATPEFADVEAAAAALVRPVRDVLELAVAAAVHVGLVPGALAPSMESSLPEHTE